MNMRKERDILMVYEDGKARGGFRITDGAWIGVKGSVVKNNPAALGKWALDEFIDHTEDYNEKALAYAINFYREHFTNGYYGITKERVQRLEALASVGLCPVSVYALDNNVRLTKELVEYVKTVRNGMYDDRVVNEFKVFKNYRQIIEDPEMPSWTKEFFREYFGNNFDIPVTYLYSAIKRCAQEKVVELTRRTKLMTFRFLSEIIIDYYKISMELFGSVKVERNFLTRYSELCALKIKYDDEHYNEVLKKHNDLSALYYEDETYIIRPLLTREEFHDEGEQQHNCVERMYMGRVHDGNTHVVQVRRKNSPNKALITCEVLNNGRIYQWLAFGNQTPSAEYVSLKRAYAQHLTENWEK